MTRSSQPILKYFKNTETAYLQKESIMEKSKLKDIIGAISDHYQASEVIYLSRGKNNFSQKRDCIPSKNVTIQILKDLRNIMFPGFFVSCEQSSIDPEYYIGQTLTLTETRLARQIQLALSFRDIEKKDKDTIENESKVAAERLIERLPYIQELLYKDIQAAFEGDPAAQSKEEIIYSYPGFFAIWVYRIAHELYKMDIPLIPRIMTEYAHSRTGVDINAGASIGEYFFIDHATGVVIGETTTIGNYVKIYQGVTLGALSTRGGQRLSGVKRHPTIEDNVTIYANACVLGGDTRIGKGSVIAGSAFVTESVPENSRVVVTNQAVTIK